MGCLWEARVQRKMEEDRFNNSKIAVVSQVRKQLLQQMKRTSLHVLCSLLQLTSNSLRPTSNSLHPGSIRVTPSIFELEKQAGRQLLVCAPHLDVATI